jgi:hypothetical protein
VVGRNAFAHEAGIHQHGILANPLCYEIMTPASVGVRETLLVLGKHSGKHAVESRLRALGVILKPEQLEAVTVRVKELADRQKFVYDDDLLALVDSAVERRPRLVRYQVLSGNEILPTAAVEIEFDGHRRSSSAVGNGTLDAALKAIDAAIGLELQLLDLHTRAVTSGKDALAEVTVRVRHADQETVGQAAATDSIEAALKAYLSAVGAARRAQEARLELPLEGARLRPRSDDSRRGSRAPSTLFEKVWDAHLVRPPSSTRRRSSTSTLHLVHEVTSPQAFSTLRERGLKVRRPDKTFATMDHAIPTDFNAATAPS